MGFEHELSAEQLRVEIRRLWDSNSEFTEALKNLPDMAPRSTLEFLINPAFEMRGVDLWQIGKEAQRKHGLDAVPPAAEIEMAAGLWVIIRDALRARKDKG